MPSEDVEADSLRAREDIDYSKIGVLGYLSKPDGIGGIIKEKPEDFIVEEITPEGIVLEVGKSQEFPIGSGDYTHFTLEKNNWDTMRALKAVARACKVSHTRIKFAGTKDRRSISAQRVSIWKIRPEVLEKVKIKDMILRDFSFSDEPVNLGSSLGNRFTITIKNVTEGADKRIEKIVKELGGKTPNFFGSQRFGIRLNNHTVGKHILKGEFRDAVLEYLCGTGDEPEEATRAREELRKTEDFKAAFHSFPAYLGFEKSVLNHLTVKPTDFVGALRVVPKKLRLMFVNSYQGYIFNLALSEYIKEGKAPKELPMVGYIIELDEATKKVMKIEGVKTGDFKISSMPEMSLEGVAREAFVDFKDFEIRDFNEASHNIKVRFSLPPGAYATVLLRELMK